MADQWYFAWGDRRFGPFSSAQLKELAALGRLQPKDTVWKEGVEKGVTAERIQYLFTAPPAPALSAESGVAPTPGSSAASEQPPHPGLPLPTDAVKLDSWVSSKYADMTPDELGADIVPDGLKLEGLPGPYDSASRSAPAPLHSPGPVPVGPTDQTPSSPVKKPVKKGRATAVKGAVLLGQDGESVQYRKKCLICGYEDASRSTMQIRNTVSTGSFFCPKCRKSGEVVMRGVR